ncbi:hypothetical protein ACA910_022119 [Epithemia clementina (nom. ined.)]
MSRMVTWIQSAAPVKNSLFQCTRCDGQEQQEDIYNDATPCRCAPILHASDGPIIGTTLVIYLRQRWDKAMEGLKTLQRLDQLCGGYDAKTEKKSTTISSAKTDAWFEKLWKLHSESNRYYHTPVHLEEMIYFLDLVWETEKSTDLHHRQNENEKTATQEQEQRQKDVIILLSIFFHDAIYNVHSATNERDSAQLFQEFFNDVVGVVYTTEKNDNSNFLAGHLGQVARLVEDCILATQNHQIPSFLFEKTSEYIHKGEKNDGNQENWALSLAALFLDLDMAVLGKEESAYLAYASMIRNEYAHVPHDTYCSKRAQILTEFLQRPRPGRIYHTSFFHQALEDQARRNLAMEIAMLQQGKIPGHEQED